MNQIRVYKQFPRFTLDINFELGRETVVLFGPSGAGKSLTLQAIVGLLRPDAGYIEVGGRVLFDSEARLNLPPQRRHVGYVMQDYALFPHLTVAENITFGLDALPRSKQQALLDEMAALLRLEGLEMQKPHQLSGGQQQRVALARALVTRPTLLLLDEPFAALDTPLRARLRRELLALQRRVQVPTIVVTHDLAEAHMLADRMAVIHDGTLHQIGTPAEVLHQPATLDAARFTGSRNIFVGRIVARDGQRYCITTRRATLRARCGACSFREGAIVSCAVRPEKVILVRPEALAEREGRREVLLCGNIVEELDHGLSHTLFFHLDNSDTPLSHVDLEVELSNRVYHLLDVPTIRHWTLSINEDDVHLIGPAVPPYFEGPAPQPPVSFDTSRSDGKRSLTED
ncbi:MAG: ABC transporter ATP-binding protein [Chloroflexota bacterium]|nr:ABC transporter ATP-binding protein [Chloroflexota bacterium]